MAKDFREYLVESSRHDVFGRYYKELGVGIKMLVNFHASSAHACTPAETLDDPYEYTHWEVTLRQANKPIYVPKIGAWDYLKHNVWAKKFEQPEFQKSMIGEQLTVDECQRMFEDVIEYAMKNNQMESEEEIRQIEAEENVKKSGCGGCGGGAKKPAPAPAE